MIMSCMHSQVISSRNTQPSSAYDAETVRRSINYFLDKMPARVIACQRVHASFHARFQ